MHENTAITEEIPIVAIVHVLGIYVIFSHYYTEIENLNFFLTDGIHVIQGRVLDFKEKSSFSSTISANTPVLLKACSAFLSTVGCISEMLNVSEDIS